MKRNSAMFRVPLLFGLALLVARGGSAQTRDARSAETRADVELPLATYDQLRLSAKGKPDVPVKAVPFGSARLVKSSMAIDLEKRRASWEAVFEVTSGGEELPAVPLLIGATPLSRWTVGPETARIDSSGDGTRLRPDGAGAWRVSLSGEVGGQGDDESLGIRFPVPRLASLPAGFDITLPEGSSASAEGATFAGPFPGRARTGRLTFERDRAAVLVVKRIGRVETGPPVVTGSLHVVDRLSEDAVRSEIRLQLRVKRGLLETKTLTFQAASLVSASGPVIATGPDKDGNLVLRFEPPVRPRGEVSVMLTFLSPRDPKSEEFVPALPRIALGAEERLERSLTLVAEGGLLAEASRDDDWAPRADLADVRLGSEDIALGFQARVEEPRPLLLSLRRLKSVAVASALAKESLLIFVGESGETRTRLVADVRSRGRSSLKFRVAADAVVLATRVDGLAAAASRPRPDQLEIPIGGESGRTRVELLLAGHIAAPRAGEKLSLVPPAPEEPLERISWSVVLPPGLRVKEEGRTVPVSADPAASISRSEAELTEADRAALDTAASLATADLLLGRDGAWSPRTDLPRAPLAYRTDLVDLGDGVLPLTLTLVTGKEENPWY
ncbi:MAG: hypothetical protein ABIT01_02135 [Thermoanaerobaculia bacterium]